MMSSGMKESRDGAAFLEDVDVKTFGRFAEYIHSGDYSVASPVEVALPLDKGSEEPTPEDVPIEPYPDGEWRESVTEPRMYEEDAAVPDPIPDTAGADPTPDPADSEWDGWGPLNGRQKKKKKARRLFDLIPDEATLPPPVQPFPMDPAPGLNESPSLSYIPTFTCHISVYHFAEEYLVPDLKHLARQRISEALNLFHCYPERADDICEVIQLVYDHEDGSSDPRSLHDMVSEYAAHNFRVLMGSARFKGLLAEGSSFSPDLCGKLLRHYL